MQKTVNYPRYYVEVTYRNYETGESKITRCKQQYKSLRAAEKAANKINYVIKPDGLTSTAEYHGKVFLDVM